MAPDAAKPRAGDGTNCRVVGDFREVVRGARSRPDNKTCWGQMLLYYRSLLKDSQATSEDAVFCMLPKGLEGRGGQAAIITP